MLNSRRLNIQMKQSKRASIQFNPKTKIEYKKRNFYRMARLQLSDSWRGNADKLVVEALVKEYSGLLLTLYKESVLSNCVQSVLTKFHSSPRNALNAAKSNYREYSKHFVLPLLVNFKLNAVLNRRCKRKARLYFKNRVNRRNVGISSKEDCFFNFRVKQEISDFQKVDSNLSYLLRRNNKFVVNQAVIDTEMEQSVKEIVDCLSPKEKLRKVKSQVRVVHFAKKKLSKGGKSCSLPKIKVRGNSSIKSLYSYEANFRVKRVDSVRARNLFINNKR